MRKRDCADPKVLNSLTRAANVSGRNRELAELMSAMAQEGNRNYLWKLVKRLGG